MSAVDGQHQLAPLAPPGSPREGVAQEMRYAEETSRGGSYGILAKILRNVEDWPIMIKIAAVAIPIILEIANLVFYGYLANPTPTYKAIWSVLAVVGPVWGMYELTSLMNEAWAQFSKPAACECLS